MPEDANGGNGHSRLDRMERLMDLLIQDNATFHERDLKFEERQAKFEERQAKFEERQAKFEERQARIQEAHEQFQYEHRQLLKAQVLLTDHVEKLDARVDRIGEKIEALTEAQNTRMSA